MSSSDFYFLAKFIDDLYISMSLATNKRDIYMLIFVIEPLMPCIKVIKCRLAVIIDSTMNLDEPGRVFQNINIRTLIVIEYVRFIILFSKRLYNNNKLTDLGWYLLIEQRDKRISPTDVPSFLQ